MSIVSTLVFVEAGHAVETHTDHLGNQYSQSWIVPAGWSQAQIDAKASASASALEDALANAEAERILGGD